ncbi:MAG: hypothetical protein ACRDTZ_25555, partial [Pseudonocardiaceae bacterium]
PALIISPECQVRLPPLNPVSDEPQRRRPALWITSRLLMSTTSRPFDVNDRPALASQLARYH